MTRFLKVDKNAEVLQHFCLPLIFQHLQFILKEISEVGEWNDVATLSSKPEKVDFCIQMYMFNAQFQLCVYSNVFCLFLKTASFNCLKHYHRMVTNKRHLAGGKSFERRGYGHICKVIFSAVLWQMYHLAVHAIRWECLIFVCLINF